MKVGKRSLTTFFRVKKYIKPLFCSLKDPFCLIFYSFLWHLFCHLFTTIFSCPMSSIREVLAISRISLIAVFSIVFFIKMILFFKYEKEWNSITFFHFTKIQLKMTVSKELRKWRKRQNKLTSLILLLALLLGITSAFHLLTTDS